MKKFMSFWVVLILLVGITQPVYAGEWKQSGSNWSYLENGSVKTGWIQDKGTWYYLIQNGIWDSTKATTIMPNEVKMVYDIVKPFVKSGNLVYKGIMQVKQGARLYTVGLSDRFLYKFTTDDNYGIQMGEYYYDPTDGKVYNLAQDGEVSLLGSGSTEYSIKKPITKEQAIENVKKYITDNKKYNPSKIEVISQDINIYTVQGMDDMGDHVTTTGWYIVDRSTGNVIATL